MIISWRVLVIPTFTVDEVWWGNEQRSSSSWVVVLFQAYTAYLTGMVEFELQEWKQAMEAFNKCKWALTLLPSVFCFLILLLIMGGFLVCLFFFHFFFFKTTDKYFCLVRTIYEKLASAFTEDLAVLYRQRVDEISPNIRYCAYNIGQHCCSRSSQCHCWCTTPILSSVLPLHTDKHTLTPWLYLILGDQNAINDLMQMRLTGGGGGMMAEKLEVNTKG